jgi:hypothetical protein
MSKDLNHGSNMRLITTYWGQSKTFKLMPVNNDCPYMEVLYDPSVGMLVALSKTMKENYEMLPQLDNEGELVHAKKAKRNGNKFKEERRLMKVPQEFYMTERDEQEAFINLFATNAEEYDFKKYLDIKPPEPSQVLQKQGAGQILDNKGEPMQAVK